MSALLRLMIGTVLCVALVGCADAPSYLTVRTDLDIEPGQVQTLELHARGTTVTVGFRAEVPVRVYVVKISSKTDVVAARKAVADGKVPAGCEILTKKPEKSGSLMFRAAEAQFYAVVIATEQKATVAVSVSDRLSSEPEAKLPD